MVFASFFVPLVPLHHPSLPYLFSLYHSPSLLLLHLDIDAIVINTVLAEEAVTEDAVRVQQINHRVCILERERDRDRDRE